MKRIHCDGCGMTVPEDAKEHDIRDVEFAIFPTDTREWVRRNSTDRHKANLCGTCRGQVLTTFFLVEREPGDIPSFLLPTPPTR